MVDHSACIATSMVAEEPLRDRDEGKEMRRWETQTYLGLIRWRYSRSSLQKVQNRLPSGLALLYPRVKSNRDAARGPAGALANSSKACLALSPMTTSAVLESDMIPCRIDVLRCCVYAKEKICISADVRRARMIRSANIITN